MSDYSDPERCEECDGVVRVGDWPFCGGDQTKHVPAEGFGEDPLTPYWDDELGAEISTRGERRRIMSKQAMEYKDVSKKQRGRVYVCLGG